MRKVLLIYTGGTIGMSENPITGALEAVCFDKLLPMIVEFQPLNIQTSTISLTPAVDSSDMGPDKWKLLVQIIADNYDNYDGFVVLHGTDTMAYTASALSFMLEGLSKPVVLTGSQLPLGKLRTDGKENIITALEIAADAYDDGRPKVPEVCIFFHDTLLRGNRTTKSSADEFDAFRSFNYPELAHAAVSIRYNEHLILPYHPERPFTPHYNMDANMLVMSLFPGIQEQTIRSMFSTPGLKGVVMRTYGAGNAPSQPWLTDILAEYVSQGIVIINITQCTGGDVAMTRYQTGLQLQHIGVIGGGDSTVEAALTKMMRLFGDGLTPSQVSRLMTCSLAGEI